MQTFASLLKDYFTLCKPKVVALMLVTTWVGMILATRTLNTLFSPQTLIFVTLGTLGIALTAFGSAVFNHLADRHIDAKMMRTLHRPIATGRISPKEAFYFGSVLICVGLLLLGIFINPLTAILAFFTMLGYAVCYTLFLKRATPQNIVIGGLAGATPPLLGWTAITGQIDSNALLLVLIIFIWTPPHFWALAIHRQKDYEKAGIPMLPVTHGVKYTKLCIFLYTCLLFAATLFPFITGMSGKIYLIAAVLLNVLFLRQAFILLLDTTHQTAQKTFNFSIAYLLLLFTSLIVDHYWYII